MGQVFRATDTKLKRQVAIKILPPLLAGDAERLARFQREAEVLASLNHPNIAAIYGLEDADGVKALVMELVEGPTLAERIVRSTVSAGRGARSSAYLGVLTNALFRCFRRLHARPIRTRPEGGRRGGCSTTLTQSTGTNRFSS